MDNILILGVEGSGKTVLAMALAKVFAAHAGDGFRLRPETRSAFRFLAQIPPSLYTVPLPPERPDRYSDMRFCVCREQQDLLAIDIPECPPELFRLAFQEGEGNSAPDGSSGLDANLQADLEALRKRMASSARVFVLFDASSIRDGQEESERIDAVWTTNACIRHLLDLPYSPAVAIVLTHADRDPAAGNDFRSILRKRLPLLADNYPDLPGFAVSSVKPEDSELGLQPLLFSLLGKTAPLDSLLAEARTIWNNLTSPEKGAPPLGVDALRMAADRLDALREQAPWFAKGPHALHLDPRISETLRSLADNAEPDPASALQAAFPGLRSTNPVVAPGNTAPAPKESPAVPGIGLSGTSGISDGKTSRSHRHHHHHHGGRHTPSRRFFRRLWHHLPWALAAILLVLALQYGIPAGHRAYARHRLEYGLRISSTRPEEARKAFLTARKHRAAGANLALAHDFLAGPAGKADPDAAADAFESCRWIYTRSADIAQIHGVVRYIRRLADSGDPAARYLVGRMLDEGKGLPHDPEGALRIMAEAAAQAQPQAMVWLVGKAASGDEGAKVALGRLCLSGKGPEDYDADSVRWVLIARKAGAPGAMEWIQSQAVSGNAYAQYVLGKNAERQNRTVQAIEWYRQAAALGNADAATALARLDGGATSD